MGINGARKGQEWERAVAAHLAAAGLAITQRRGRGQTGDDMTAVCPDGTALSVEAKNARTLALAQWLDQARQQDRADGATPVVIVHRRGKASPAEAYAVLQVSDPLALLLHNPPHNDSGYY